MVTPTYVQKIVPNCKCVDLCNFKRSEEKGKLTDALCKRLPESQAVKSAISSVLLNKKEKLVDKQDFSPVSAIKKHPTGEDFSSVSIIK